MKDKRGLVEIRVSADEVETWHRREVDLAGDLEEFGLQTGEVFEIRGEQY